MAFSISNLFGGTPTPDAAPAQPAQPAPAQPGNLPPAAPADPTKVPGTTPNDGTPTNSPLDQFKDLWEPVKNEAGDQTPVELDAAKVSEAMSKADFSNVLNQENLSAIAQGGEPAMKAFQDSLNAVARQVMTQSTLISNKMIEQAVAKATKEQQAKLPDLLKRQSLKENLADSNPLFNNPAVKPVIEAVQSQLAAKYPNATTTELAKMATDFVTVMGEQFAPKKTEQNPKGVDQTDWSAFLDFQG